MILINSFTLWLKFWSSWQQPFSSGLVAVLVLQELLNLLFWSWAWCRWNIFMSSYYLLCLLLGPTALQHLHQHSVLVYNITCGNQKKINRTCLFPWFINPPLCFWFRPIRSSVVAFFVASWALYFCSYSTSLCCHFGLTLFPSPLFSWPSWHPNLGCRLWLATIFWPLIHSFHGHHAVIIDLVVLHNWITVCYVVLRRLRAKKECSNGMCTRYTCKLLVPTWAGSFFYVNRKLSVLLSDLISILAIPNYCALLCQVNVLVQLLQDIWIDPGLPF